MSMEQTKQSKVDGNNIVIIIMPKPISMQYHNIIIMMDD